MDVLFHYDFESTLYVPVNEDTNGTVCPYYILEDPIFKKGAAYVSILRDLNDCIESIEYLKKINTNKTIPQIVKTSILFASIVKYAKCFNSATGRGTSLNDKDVFKKTKPTLKQFHQTTMNLRNKYVAHAGDSGHERGAMILILNPDLNNKEIYTMQYGGISLKDDDSNIENYLTLFNEVKEWANQRFNAQKKAMKKEVSELDIETIYRHSKTPNLEKSHQLITKSMQ